EQRYQSVSTRQNKISNFKTGEARDLVIANEEQHFASLIAGDIEGIVRDFYEVGVVDALQQHVAPLVAGKVTAKRGKGESVSVADLIDAEHGATEAVGMDGACATVAGKGQYDGSFYLDESSVDRPCLGVVVMGEFPSAVKRKRFLIAGDPQYNGEGDPEFAFHTRKVTSDKNTISRADDKRCPAAVGV